LSGYDQLFAGTGLTSNPLESFHQTLKATLKPHPSMEAFLTFVKEDFRRSEAFIAQVILLRGCNGK
jgi:hypothetical protein